MAKTLKQHVVPDRKSGWSVRKEGASQATKTFKSQGAAVTYAREIALKNKTDLYVHNRDGTIREMRSYGKSPFPPKAKK